jgi:hypothetical protein
MTNVSKRGQLKGKRKKKYKVHILSSLQMNLYQRSPCYLTENKNQKESKNKVRMKKFISRKPATDTPMGAKAGWKGKCFVVTEDHLFSIQPSLGLTIIHIPRQL